VNRSVPVRPASDYFSSNTRLRDIVKSVLEAFDPSHTFWICGCVATTFLCAGCTSGIPSRGRANTTILLSSKARKWSPDVTGLLWFVDATTILESRLRHNDQTITSDREHYPFANLGMLHAKTEHRLSLLLPFEMAKFFFFAISQIWNI
jgi:hypothetical protein